MELYGSLWNLQHLCVYYATYEIWPFLWPKSGFADVKDGFSAYSITSSRRLQQFKVKVVYNSGEYVGRRDKKM